MTDTKRPNILILIPHDLGDFLGCYGHDSVRSPHLDRLATRGVRFENCFCTSPECTPSRGGLLTGLYPHQNGLLGLSNFGWSLRVPHVAERLRDLGYETHQFGFQHETHEPAETLGYQHVHPGYSNGAGDVCAELSEFVREAASADTTAPWFAYAGFSHVHRRWCRLEESSFDPADVSVPEWLPDRPTVRKDLARFHQDIEDMDAAVGGVLETLRECGADADTLVIFTTDHGAAFPGAKATFYDPGIHVPLILRWAGHIEGGVEHDALISNMDVTPTLLELAGGTVPDGLAGRSFLPLLRNQQYERRDSVAGALFYDVAYDPMHYIRTATHKYIRSFAATDEEAAGADPETLTSFAAGRWVRVDDFDVLTGPSCQDLVREGSAERPEREELYDLAVDPAERRNLVHDPDAGAVLADMRARLDEMMRSTESPLLEGHVPPPERQKEAKRSHSPGGERFREECQRRKELL